MRVAETCKQRMEKDSIEMQRQFLLVRHEYLGWIKVFLYLESTQNHLYQLVTAGLRERSTVKSKFKTVRRSLSEHAKAAADRKVKYRLGRQSLQSIAEKLEQEMECFKTAHITFPKAAKVAFPDGRELFDETRYRLGSLEVLRRLEQFCIIWPEQIRLLKVLVGMRGKPFPLDEPTPKRAREVGYFSWDDVKRGMKESEPTGGAKTYVIDHKHGGLVLASRPLRPLWKDTWRPWVDDREHPEFIDEYMHNSHSSTLRSPSPN